MSVRPKKRVGTESPHFGCGSFSAEVRIRRIHREFRTTDSMRQGKSHADRLSLVRVYGDASFALLTCCAPTYGDSTPCGVGSRSQAVRILGKRRSHEGRTKADLCRELAGGETNVVLEGSGGVLLVGKQTLLRGQEGVRKVTHGDGIGPFRLPPCLQVVTLVEIGLQRGRGVVSDAEAVDLAPNFSSATGRCHWRSGTTRVWLSGLRAHIFDSEDRF